MNLKLEVVVIPVSDVDRAKAFYEKVGFRLDIDHVANENFRGIQFTPPQSEASIIFGKGSRRLGLARRTWSSPWITSTPTARTN